MPVTTAPAQTGAITATIRASGLVTPAPGAELIVVAPEPARIAAIPKAEGDVVRVDDDQQIQQAGHDQERVAVFVADRPHVAGAQRPRGHALRGVLEN